MTLLVIVPSLVCVAAAAALAYALRGRQVDDHPVCRKCGFDLIGKPAGSTVCSECGSDVSRRRAVRVGRREKRRGLAAAAAPVLVLCLGWLSFVGWRAARQTEWDRHKPVWWLMREAQGRDVGRRDAAFVELASRMAGDKLSPEQEAALIDAALGLQADRKRPWTASVGAVIAGAADWGKLPEDKWQRYLWQAAPPELVVRPVVRRGDPVTFAMAIPAARLAEGHSFDSAYQVVGARVGDVVGSTPAPPGIVGARRGHFLYPGATAERTTYEMPEAGDTVAALREGCHTLRVSVRLEMRDRSRRRRPHTSPLGPPTRFERRRDLSAQVTVVPRQSAAVVTILDPALRPAVEQAVTAQLRVADSSGYLTMVVDANKPPIDLACTVVARHRGREWRLGHATFNAGQRGRANIMHRLFTELPEVLPDRGGGPPAPARIDLILRPSVEQAVRTVDMTRIWGGEIVFKDLPMNR